MRKLQFPDEQHASLIEAVEQACEAMRLVRGRPYYPTARKTLRLLRALQAGERLTVAKALTAYGVYACSQEMGRLRRLGWDVQSERIEVSPGVWVKEYRL